MTYPIRIGVQLQPQHADHAQIRGVARADDGAGRYGAVGRDAALIERSVGVEGPSGEAEGLVEAGATLFTVGLGGPDYDLSVAEQWVAWRDARG